MLNLKHIIILIGITIVVYSATLFSGFMWDDEDLILGDRYVSSFKNIGYVFGSDYWKNDFPGSEGRYRPLRALSFMVDHKLWGTSPYGYHITNLFLHVLASLLVYKAALLLTGESISGLFSGLIFALHPVHVESVAWVKNRSDLISCIFYLAALIMFVLWYVRNKRITPANWAVISLFFVLALMGKEMAITLPLVMLAYLVVLEKKRFAEALRTTLPVLAISGIYLVFILTLFRSSKLGGRIDLISNLLAGFQYLRLLVLPYGLNAERTITTPVDLIGPVFFIVTGYLILKKSDYTKFFLFLWIFITIMPVLDLRLMTARPIAEQRLYIPSIAMSILAGSFLSRTFLRQAAFVFIIIGFSTISFARTLDWKDPVVFWEKTVKQSPDSARARNNLGVSYERDSRVKEALSQYDISIMLDPEKNPEVFVNIANIFLNNGNLEKAEEYYKKASDTSSESVNAQLGLGKVYLAKADYAQAETSYKRILELDPKNFTAYNSLGVIYSSRGDMENAKNYYERSLAIYPEYIDALYNLAVLYQTEGDQKKAIEIYKELLSFDSKNENAKNNLAIAYDLTGNSDQAAVLFKEIITETPGYFQAHYNLGNFYLKNGSKLEALAQYANVLEIFPGHEQARIKYHELKKALQ